MKFSNFPSSCLSGIGGKCVTELAKVFAVFGVAPKSASVSVAFDHVTMCRRSRFKCTPPFVRFLTFAVEKSVSCGVAVSTNLLALVEWHPSRCHPQRAPPDYPYGARQQGRKPSQSSPHYPISSQWETWRLVGARLSAVDTRLSVVKQ